MKTAALALVFGLASATAALSATIKAEFWDAPSSFRNVQEAIDYARANTATSTFRSTMLDYPNAGHVVRSGRTSLADFLGRIDAQTLTGSRNTTLTYSVFRFTGLLDLDPGTYSMTVGSDDGFRLIFSEGRSPRVVAERARPRAFRPTTRDVTVSGNTRFTLFYYENRGRTGVTFSIDGNVVDASDVLAPVPLPAGMPLILAGLAGLGLMARKSRKSRA